MAEPQKTRKRYDLYEFYRFAAGPMTETIAASEPNLNPVQVDERVRTVIREAYTKASLEVLDRRVVANMSRLMAGTLIGLAALLQHLTDPAAIVVGLFVLPSIVGLLKVGGNLMKSAAHYNPARPYEKTPADPATGHRLRGDKEIYEEALITLRKFVADRKTLLLEHRVA